MILHRLLHINLQIRIWVHLSVRVVPLLVKLLRTLGFIRTTNREDPNKAAVSRISCLPRDKKVVDDHWRPAQKNLPKRILIDTRQTLYHVGKIFTPLLRRFLERIFLVHESGTSGESNQQILSSPISFQGALLMEHGYMQCSRS